MADFSLSRAITVAASPERLHALVDDFHHWVNWSPWEGLDPDLQRTYSGPESGVGAQYGWVGNSKAGEGSMRITDSGPHAIEVELAFVKPFKATNTARFTFEPVDEGTRLTWHMTGQRNPLMQVLGKLFFDRAIAKDFDRGLARLKTLAETRSA